MTSKEGYSLCFNEWALDKEIKSELGLLLIISSYTSRDGYCYATNQHFASLFGLDEVSISRKIKKLEEKKYISIDYEYRGFEVIKREIRLTKMLNDHLQNCKSSINKNVNRTINKNVKDNNISIIIKDNNKKFIKPTMEEIKIFIEEKFLNVDFESFYYYYESNGWKVGKNPMKDWKATLYQWNARNKKQEPKKQTAPYKELSSYEIEHFYD